MWINFRIDEATNFFVHAAKCHRESPVTSMQNASASQSRLPACPSNSFLSSSSTAGTKRKSDPLDEIAPSNASRIANARDTVKKARGNPNEPAGDDLEEEETENAAQRFFNQIAVRRSSRNRTGTNL